jgi:protein-disulfide isomerase
LSNLALIVSFLAVSACTPACAPPEAASPESGATPEKSAATPAPVPKGDMIMEAKGVDLGKLSDPQRSSFFTTINTEPSACDKPHSMATSLRDDTECRDSLVAAQFIADRLAMGATPSAIKAEVDLVRSALRPRAVKMDDRPVWGNERAPVTIAMFADFQCPHCRAEVPVLRAAVDKYRGRARVIFKHFPLRSHPEAKQAAIACEAARAQDKFWEMHDAVFAHQQSLTDDEILALAGQIGLDIAKFKTDWAGDAARARVEEDRAEGETFQIEGTPAVFVNGRYFTELLFGGTIEGWVDEALKR